VAVVGSEIPAGKLKTKAVEIPTKIRNALTIDNLILRVFINTKIRLCGIINNLMGNIDFIKTKIPE